MVTHLVRPHDEEDEALAKGFFGCEAPERDSVRACEMDADRFTQLYANPCLCKRPTDYICTSDKLVLV